jgi:hypothetical protein
MRPHLAALALLSSIISADAQSLLRTCTRGTCSFLFSPGATYAPAVQYLPRLSAQEEAARDARIAEWEARCKPTLSEPNELGVRHYRYAAKGCEHGN